MQNIVPLTHQMLKAFRAKNFSCQKLVLMFCLIQIHYSFGGNPIINNTAIVQQMFGDYSTDIVIYPGNVVDVTDRVRMYPDKKIVVHPGAVLRINNQTITVYNNEIMK